ncbi:hypothetical protein F5144DRAFT_397885 [Chaetomium tenue]|uniref:Uncharacterized protein n=1 Tax=Chaetomium tenue TaxID=1854479 RepID=A0ACB7NXX1_9PEZI|nr:hypothetical protein F5144DRAFT_397885 [Chaetomium globosum]
MGQGRTLDIGRKPKIADVPAPRCRFDRSSPPRTTAELGAMEFRFRHMEDSAGTPHLRNRNTNHVGSMQAVCPNHRAEIAGCRNHSAIPLGFRPVCYSMPSCAGSHPTQLWLVVCMCLMGWMVTDSGLGVVCVARSVPSLFRQIFPIPVCKPRRTSTSEPACVHSTQ